MSAHNRDERGQHKVLGVLDCLVTNTPALPDEVRLIPAWHQTTALLTSAGWANISSRLHPVWNAAKQDALASSIRENVILSDPNGRGKKSEYYTNMFVDQIIHLSE